MAIRSTVGSVLESAIGRERTNNLRRLERRTRHGASEEAGRNVAAQTRESQTTINCSAIALAAPGSVHRAP